VVSVADGDAILMAQKLAASLGLAVGISSGANFVGALMIQNQMGDPLTVALLGACDRSSEFSTTRLFRSTDHKERLNAINLNGGEQL